MRKLFYVGLEPYEGRYTLQLQDWNERAFKKKGIDYEIVKGKTIDDSKEIKVGQVLDAHGRSYFALSQMMNIVQMLRDGDITGDDCLYFEDMFHPGIEALPYIFYQTDKDKNPDVWVRCLAQSIDPDDFIHVCGMEKWMMKYEALVNEFVTGVLASNEEMVAHMKIAGWEAPIYNISGLAFDKEEVISRVNRVKPWHEKKRRAVFSSRWDMEKQPHIFMDLAEMCVPGSSIEFAVLQGGPLKSNNPDLINRLRKLERKGLIIVHENLKKNEYYEILNDSRLLFNCALQDWTSNTLSEADALGCNVLFPAYRSFPEVLNNDSSRMYIPWDIDNMSQKINLYLIRPQSGHGVISEWTSSTIERILGIIMGEREDLKRDKGYRSHVSEYKYC